MNPVVEGNRAAATQTIAAFDEANAEKVRRDEFKAKLREAIDKATPQPTTEAAAEQVMQSGAKDANATLRGQLTTEREAAAGSMRTAMMIEVPAAAPSGRHDATPQPEPIGAPPAQISASSVVPTPLPAERLDYSSDRGPTDQLMAENNVTQEQMQEGNDPAFGPTIAARSSAENHEAAIEARYRQGENTIHGQAQNAAAQALAGDLAGMHGVREQQIGRVFAQQLGTTGKDAQERKRITDDITNIKNDTRKEVNSILTSMETEAGNIFEAGLKRAEETYEEAFEEEKGGIGTWLTTWGSDWEKLIERALATARRRYLQEVGKAIDEVATLVDDKLKAAKKCVTDGREKVANYVKRLDDRVKQFGEEALQTVSGDFDAMVSDIDQRRDGLINKLTEQYKASYERMSAMENRLREANKSLWQRVYDATVGLIKRIIAFKDMLLSILGRAASVILDIISHPIRFLGNLVTGVMQGLKSFMSKLPTYLQKGIMDWLFGALAGAGLQLPDTFDLPGIISIVLQILGLTYANFRARAVAIVGEPVVAAIERTAEVFKVFITEGVSGLWRFIKEQLANLKSMVLDAIFDFIKEKVIVAGITWIIGLLNPASAFFKACKAIYDIVMFFINRGSQILALVNAVIDSISAIARGAVGVAAGLVENALAKAIPVAIGFLAGLLGLGDPSKPVRAFIEKARAPVNKAIDWLINGIVSTAKKLAGAVKAGVKRVLNWWTKKVPVAGGGETHTLTFEGTERNAILVLRSAPEKPSIFLARTAEKKGIEQGKRVNPIKITEKQETVIEALVSSLQKIDEREGPAAAGRAADRADKLTEQLDTKLGTLGTHIGSTLSDWGVGDEIVKEVSLPRSKFTVEQKRRIAAQHANKNQLRKDSRGEPINIEKGLARRHVVSSSDMSKHYVGALTGKKASEAKLLLEQRGSIAESKIPVEAAKPASIQKAATTRYTRFFGYIKNLFIGDSRENSMIQEHLDAGHPELAEEKLEEHVRHVKRAWALDQSMQISRLNED